MDTRSIAAVCLVFLGCGLDVAEGNGVPAEESRKVGQFESAVVDSGLELVLDTSGDSSGTLVVSADENLLPLIETSVTDGWLTVRAKQPISSGRKLEVRGSAPGLLRIGAMGGATATALELDRDEVFETSMDRGGTVNLFGRAARLDALVTGGSRLAAGELSADEVRMEIAGGSRALVCANETLIAAAHDGSVVTYRCDPERVEPTTSGGGVIAPVD